jgi:hypothetical protein
MSNRGEHQVEYLEAGEVWTESLPATEQPLDLVAAPVNRLL